MKENSIMASATSNRMELEQDLDFPEIGINGCWTLWLYKTQKAVPTT